MWWVLRATLLGQWPEARHGAAGIAGGNTSAESHPKYQLTNPLRRAETPTFEHGCTTVRN